MSTITARLSVREAAKAIEFYQQAFRRAIDLHAQDARWQSHARHLKLGDSRFQLGDEFPGMGAPSPQTLGGSPMVLNICVENVDELFNRAVAAGAKVTMPLTNQFWGARYGQILDPFGFTWALFSHVEDVSPEELERRADAASAKMPA